MTRLSTVILCFVLFLCSSCGKGKKTAPPVSPVTFAVIGNTGMASDNGLALSALTGAVNKSGVEFTVDLGNRLPPGAPSTGLEALWRAVDRDMEKFAMPVFPVAGSRDIFDAQSNAAYVDHYGPPWYSFVRGGTTFVMLHTGDESYRTGFGMAPSIGNEQIEWLGGCARNALGGPMVLFMNRPLWKDAPSLWRDRILPALGTANVVLAVSASDEGLCDCGKVDGIRVVTTGCTGTTGQIGPGLYPHALLVRVNGRDISIRVLKPDGTFSDKIDVDQKARERYESFLKSFAVPSVRADAAWKVNDSYDMNVENPFDSVVSGSLVFKVHPDTEWNIEPSKLVFSIQPGSTSTFHLNIRGNPPELGPQPSWTLRLAVGKEEYPQRTGTVEVRIPRPKTGAPGSIDAGVPDVIQYAFDGSPLLIPVTVKGNDLSGRLAIFRHEGTDPPVCVHISNLREFTSGTNEFVWNGRDLTGDRVKNGDVTFNVFVYNKKSPVTWVADGPRRETGSFTVAGGPGPLTGQTHTDRSVLEYRIGGSLGDPKSETIQGIDELLGGAAVMGFTDDGGRRVFFSTDAGLACTFVSGGRMRQDVSFADKGFLRFSSYRGRAIGSPAYGGGKVYVGVGGGPGEGPCVVMVDAESGKMESKIDLEEYFGRETEPPSVAADESGVIVAHPMGDIVLRLARDGTVSWINESGDDFGDIDTDGRSFVYGIGRDQYGNLYMSSPGTSARCGVVGPDGRGLFRVILVQLPGLRVSSVYPLIEGKTTDGLYFVTRGGDRPYVFHVPYTIRAGEIVHRSRMDR